jgi:hypothetical protein
MLMMETFLEGNVSIEIPDERATFRDEQAAGNVSRRFFARPEREIPPTSDHCHHVISASTLITRDDSFRD